MFHSLASRGGIASYPTPPARLFPVYCLLQVVSRVRCGGSRNGGDLSTAVHHILEWHGQNGMDSRSHGRTRLVPSFKRRLVQRLAQTHQLEYDERSERIQVIPK